MQKTTDILLQEDNYELIQSELNNQLNYCKSQMIKSLDDLKIEMDKRFANSKKDLYLKLSTVKINIDRINQL